MKEFAPFLIADIAEMLHGLGYKGRVVLGEEHSYVESATSGDEFLVTCYSAAAKPLATAEEPIEFIRFQCTWFRLVDQNEPELDSLCNWFNAVYPFSKLYRGASDYGPYLTLEAEVYVYDGMPTEKMQRHLSRYINHADMTKLAISRCRRISRAEISERHNRALEFVHGLEKNFEEAAKLYRENAHLGYAGSQNNFGDMFEEGLGLPQDELLAVYWYTRAAERGEPTAYLSLATLLSKSTDNVDAEVMAAMYANLAVALLPEGTNKKSAEATRDELRDRLVPEAFRYAEQLARDFRPLYNERATMGDTPGPLLTKIEQSTALN